MTAQADIEFAVSHGEGTLLNHGVLDAKDRFRGVHLLSLMDSVETEGHTVIVGPAAPDCETGK